MIYKVFAHVLFQIYPQLPVTLTVIKNRVRFFIVRLPGGSTATFLQMKQLITLFLLSGSLLANAQQTHFIFLQTDNRQPFYVTLNSKNYSSSSIGHLIIPKVADGNYAIKIGFPKDQTEQVYNVDVKGKDLGLSINSFGEKGWGMMNLQTFAVQMNGEAAKLAQASKAAAEKQQQDSINSALAQQAAQKRADSLKNEVAKQDAVRKAEALKAEQGRLAEKAVADSIIAAEEAARLAAEKKAAQAAQDKLKQTPVVTQPVTITKTEPVAVQTPPVSPKPASHEMEKLGEQDSDSGLTVIYRDGNDTVRAFFPAQKTAVKQAKPAEPVEITPVVATPVESKPAPEETPKKPASTKPAGPGFLNMEISYDSGVVSKPIADDTIVLDVNPKKTPPKTTEKKPEQTPVSESPAVKQVGKPPVYNAAPKNPSTGLNSNCGSPAAEKDFFTLRKKMVASEDADEMVLAAKKSFKERCYTTEQVRNLAVLFLNDKDRYAFLDAAYPFTYDSGKFGGLKDLLKDEYYLNRFKAMVRE